VVDNLEPRAPFRQAHLELVQQARARGELVMAGSFRDPVDGALLIFRAEDPSTAERFANTDPYVSEGLVAAWRVRKLARCSHRRLTRPASEARALVRVRPLDVLDRA
jgi:uncharacterized protein